MSSWDKKLNSELNDEKRYSLASIEQMHLLAARVYNIMTFNQHILIVPF